MDFVDVDRNIKNLLQVCSTGKLDHTSFYKTVDTTWDKFIKLVDKITDGGHYNNSSSKWRVDLLALQDQDCWKLLGQEAYDVQRALQNIFTEHTITLIAFTGFTANNRSFPVHRDGMDVVLLQALGNVHVEHQDKKNHVSMSYFMQPGDLTFIPRGVDHRIIPHGSRVTYSFGIEGEVPALQWLRDNGILHKRSASR